MAAAATNIWNEFLSKSSNRTQNEYSTVVVLGDQGSGKTALIEKICADKNLSMQVEVSCIYIKNVDKSLRVITSYQSGRRCCRIGKKCRD